MIINIIRRGFRLSSSLRFRCSKIAEGGSSQLDQFKQHLLNLDKQQSLEAAANMYTQLQMNEQSLKDRLLQLESDYNECALGNPTLVKLIELKGMMLGRIDECIEQNKQIEIRCKKEVENVKIYGITKIAKEIINIADHISQAKKTVLASQSKTKDHALQQLEKVHAQLRRICHKYNIEEFDPKGAEFNPNQHESMVQIPTNDPKLKNTVAETLRSGFKIKDRLLRSAYVVIYS